MQLCSPPRLRWLHVRPHGLLRCWFFSSWLGVGACACVGCGLPCLHVWCGVYASPEAHSVRVREVIWREPHVTKMKEKKYTRMSTAPCCQNLAPRPLESLWHLFLQCGVGKNALRWLVALWAHINPQAPEVPLVATVLLADNRAELRPSNGLGGLWTVLRVTMLHSIWAVRCAAKHQQGVFTRKAVDTSIHSRSWQPCSHAAAVFCPSGWWDGPGTWGWWGPTGVGPVAQSAAAGRPVRLGANMGRWAAAAGWVGAPAHVSACQPCGRVTCHQHSTPPSLTQAGVVAGAAHEGPAATPGWGPVLCGGQREWPL
jgi:hypothetical protein